MRNAIATILLVIWFLSLAIGVAGEPSDTDVIIDPAPTWAGYLIIALWFLLPIIALKLIDDKKQ